MRTSGRCVHGCARNVSICAQLATTQQAHSAPVTRLSWAHPEYGTILASCSFDKLVKVWEEIGPGRMEPDNTAPAPGTGGIGGSGGATGTVGSASRWVERAKFVESKASVRAIEFAPRYFGLKLVIKLLEVCKEYLLIAFCVGRHLVGLDPSYLRMPRPAQPLSMECEHNRGCNQYTSTCSYGWTGS